MSVANVGSSASSPYLNTAQNQFQQRRADFQQLAKSLNAGDLSGAQQAFAALQSLMPTPGGNAGGNNSPSSGSPGGNNSPLAGDMTALGQALQSGDLASAQKSFADIMQQLQGAGQAHHHHHHGGTTGSTAAGTTSSGATVTSTLSADSDGDNDNRGGGGINVQA